MRSTSTSTLESIELLDTQNGEDILISQSPDNAHIVMRHHSKSSDTFVVANADGTVRKEIPRKGWIGFVGWLIENE